MFLADLRLYDSGRVFTSVVQSVPFCLMSRGKDLRS